jgi:phage terminase large subunit-like protein
VTAAAADRWRELPPDTKRALRDRLRQRVVAQLRQLWRPYPWQVPPAMADSDLLWLLMGGRGTGKTDGAAHYVLDHVNGPACDPRLPGGHRIAIVAPTIGDAVESCVTGPSGLQAYDPTVVLRGSRGGTYVRFTNGAVGKLFGCHTPDDVNRLRSGGNRCLVWGEELAAWRQLGGDGPLQSDGTPHLQDTDAWPNLLLGLRLGPRPHMVASTTPKPRALLRHLVARPDVQVTHGRTDQAHHLDPVFRKRVTDMYEGTRLARQELGGELLADVEGALWTQLRLDYSRVRGVDPVQLAKELARVAVQIDPAATNTASSDETGIVVVGASKRSECPVCGPLGGQAHGFVLADYSGRMDPGSWADTAVQAYHLYGADVVLGETNNGGDMVGHTVSVADKTVAYDTVTATRGKMTRADPIAALWTKEPPRAHIVGTLPRLEDQLTTWVPKEGDSPDRLDAAVWGLTKLLLKAEGSFAAVV